MAPQRVFLHTLTAWAVQALEDVGVPTKDARVTAEALVKADAWGVSTHGIKLLPGYLRRLREGGLKPEGTPSVVAEGPAWARIDGDASLGQVTSHFAMRTAIAKAKRTGVAYVGVCNSCHFGAAGVYAEMAAEAGMLGQAMANDVPGMGPPGACQAVFGTNPFAFAAPTPRGFSILLDMALSTVAGGKVFAARQRSEPISDQWLIDAEGRPTDDATAFPGSAILSTMAGYKGYGLALMNEILSGVLPGAGVTWGVGSYLFGDQTTPTNHGACFVAIDIEAITPRATYDERIGKLIDELHAVPTAEGDPPLRLPGEAEAQREKEALREGMVLPSDVSEALRPLTEAYGWNMGRPGGHS